MASVSLEGVSKRFGATRAVENISLTVADGEFFALLGPSGCGQGPRCCGWWRASKSPMPARCGWRTRS
jgi:ABC-type uncharacterized transport system YnjBCD ATPase subunit